MSTGMRHLKNTPLIRPEREGAEEDDEEAEDSEA